MKSGIAGFLLAAAWSGLVGAEDSPQWKKLQDETHLRKMLVEHSELKDPFSVQFRNVFVIEIAEKQNGAESERVYCGEVNAKNSYGGYVGWKQFTAYDVGGEPKVTVEEEEADLLMIGMFCSKAPRN